MDISKSNNINISEANNIKVSSPIKKLNEENNEPIFKNDIQPTKTVQLDDFFGFLDKKTIQKIIDTPAESKARITQDIAKMEYETDGARAILNSLG